MKRITFFLITLFCVIIHLKGSSIEKSSEREIDVFGSKLSVEEVRLVNSNYVKNITYRLANPCEYFKEYTCRNANKLAKKEMQDFRRFFKSVLNLSKKLTENLDGNENAQPVTAEDKYKMYYSSCVHQNKEQTPYFDEIFKVLEPYGGVPFRNPNWKSDNFDWIKFSAFAMRFNIPTLFEALPSFEDGIRNQHVGIEIRNMRNYINWEKHEEFMIKIMKLSGIESETVAETVKKIISFKKALLEIGGGDDIESMTMEDFTKKYPEINWKSYFSTLFDKNEADLDLSEVIRVKGNNFVKNIVELITNTNSEIVANYMGWEFLQTVIELLGNRYLNKFENLLSTELEDEKDLINWNNYFNTQCFRELNYLFLPILGSFFFNNYYDSNLDDDIVKMSFEIKLALQNFLRENYWMDDTGATNEYLNSIKFEVTRPDVLSIKELNEFYADLKITPNNYIENWFNTRKFETMRIYKTETVSKAWMSLTTASFEIDSNVFKIPIEYLMLPQFHRYLHNGLKFGHLGVAIAQHLIYESPFFQNRTVNWEIKLKDFWDCYQKEFDITSSGMDFDINYFIALQISFEAYKKRINNLNKSGDEKLADYDLSENQLFFITSIQPFCYSHDLNMKRILAFYANLDEFAEAFSCQFGTPMNPTTNCNLINNKEIFRTIIFFNSDY